MDGSPNTDSEAGILFSAADFIPYPPTLAELLHTFVIKTNPFFDFNAMAESDAEADLEEDFSVCSDSSKGSLSEFNEDGNHNVPVDKTEKTFQGQ